MMKIIASLLILGLCANVCFAATVAPTSSSQGSAFSGLNSSATKVYSVANQTSDSNWDSTAASATATAATGIPDANVIFGPGTTNGTSYVYGYILSTPSTIQQITKIVKRTLNNTIVGYGTDTTEASVAAADIVISSSIVSATSPKTAVGPGYLAFLTQGSDGTNNQVWINLLSGSTPSQTKLTTTLDIVSATQSATQGCTTTTFGLGNIWYDIGSSAFFYTYYKLVITYTGASAGAACGSTGGASVYTIYLGGIFTNGSAYLSPLALTPVTTGNVPSNLVSGGDNWLNSSNIYVVYKDAAKSTGGANSATGVTYQTKITKSSTATAGSFTALVSDTIVGTIANNVASTPVVTTTFVPLNVWSSNSTYGIAVSNATYTQSSTQYPNTAGTYVYAINNYLNSALTYADSGITYSSATGVNGLWGWQLTTGYTLVASWATSTTGINAYTWGSFYSNGSVNTTATTGTLATSVYGPVSFYEDVNGTQWIGWTDYDTSTNTPILTTAGYLAKLQGQLNTPSGANILYALSVFALFLVIIFAF